MILEGKEVYIRPLKENDISSMTKWGRHENPLLNGYNFPKLTKDEQKEWFEYKTQSIFQRYYAILNKDDSLIGYLGIREINILFREATLGIVLDPEKVGIGYGSESLYLFLNYFFYDLNMRKMNLKVDKFNERAINLYKKCGFVIKGEELDLFLGEEIDMESEEYLKYKTHFVMKNDKIYNYMYSMELTKDDFEKSRIVE